MNTTKLANGFCVASMPLGPIGTNSHIFYKEQKALIIDAPLDSLEAISTCLKSENLEAKALLLTHGHWDHMGGAALLKQKYGIPCYGSTQDAMLFENPQIMSAFSGNFELKPVAIDKPIGLSNEAQANMASSGSSSELDLKPNLELSSWPDLQLEVFAMPGHTPGGLAFYFPQASCVMTGDQLFQGSVGRSDFPGGDFALLAASIRSSLYTLPEQTIVFPGHGSPTTIGQEMQHNPFVPAV